MRTVRILVVAVAALIGVGLLYLADRFQSPPFLQGVANDTFGAAITALATWAFFWPTKRLELARSFRRNHIDLLILAVAPKQLSWQVVEIFCDRARTLTNDLPDALKSSAVEYILKLEGFRNLYDSKNPSNDPKNNAQGYREKWNATCDPLVALLKKLDRNIGREAEKHSDRYKISAGQIEVPTIPTSRVTPLNRIDEQQIGQTAALERKAERI